MGKSRKEEEKRQPNPWNHFRRARAQLGQGGVKFARRENGNTYALPCGPDNSTITATQISYSILDAELSQFYSHVKARGGHTSGAELRERFQDSPLTPVADESDWQAWAEGFSPKNPNRGRPKSAALTFLERKMSLDRGTIKSYLSRAKKVTKRQK